MSACMYSDSASSGDGVRPAAAPPIAGRNRAPWPCSCSIVLANLFHSSARVGEVMSPRASRMAWASVSTASRSLIDDEDCSDVASATSAAASSGIVGRFLGAQERHRLLAQRDGLVVDAQVVVHLREQRQHFDLRLRRGGQRRLDLHGALVEKLERGRLPGLHGVALVAAAGAEDITQRIAGWRRRAAPRCARRGLVPRQRRRCHQHADDGGARADAELVPQDELACAIERAFRLGEDDLAAQVAPDVLGERADGRVAVRCGLVERLADNRIEIAREPPAQVPRRRARARCGVGGHHRRRTRHVLGEIASSSSAREPRLSL